MITICVTGGRDFKDRGYVFQCLDRLHKERGIAALHHGGARGVDQFASEWAASRNVPKQAHPITIDDRKLYGNSAGRVRNRRMLERVRPDFLARFDGGNGTKHCARLAIELGIPLIHY